MFRYGIPSLLLIGALLIGIFYLKPAWSRFQEIRAQTEHIRALSAEFDELIQNRDTLIAKLNLVSKDDLQKLEALIPKRVQSLEYLIALQHLAQESGVALTFTKADISPPASSPSEAGQRSSQLPSSATQPEDPDAAISAPRPPRMLNLGQPPQAQTLAVKDLPVGISVTGSYEALKKFVGRLERFERLTDIPALNVAAQDNSFMFSLNIITHYQ